MTDIILWSFDTDRQADRLEHSSAPQSEDREL